MSGTTSRFAFPYPSPTDPLKEGAAKVKAFAEGADAAILNRSYGKSIIATQQTRENTVYGKLTTPDEVTVVMPENGLIAVGFQATWESSVQSAGRAAIFIGTNQLKISVVGQPEAQAAPSGTAGWNDLVSSCGGLVSSRIAESTSSPPATTGQVLGAGVFGEENFRTTIGATGPPETAGKFAGGPCYIFAAAGTYTISVQFKTTSGSVIVKNRKLWVWSMF
jgi:hypothetical protein